MKHYDYYYSETWGGCFEVLAESREEADEKVRTMNHNDLKRSGLLDSLSIDRNETVFESEWEEKKLVYFDETDWKDRVVRSGYTSIVPELFQSESPPPSFTEEELNLISDALTRAIMETSQALALVHHAPAQKEIKKHIETIRALNSKVCGMMK